VTSAPLAPWVFAALGIHAFLAIATPRTAEPHDETRPPLEIDLSPPPLPQVPPPHEEPPPALDPAPPPVAAPARPLAPAAPAARAAAILTAAPSAPDTPVTFVTDPNGASFGYGVVMRGGTATQASSAPASPRPPSTPPSRTVSAPVETMVPPSDWTRAPRLDETDPCRGFFPRHAVADASRVTLAVVIEPGGQVRSASVVEEAPPGDGFGEAARTCLHTKVFAPALGRDGRPVRATATVRIRFSR
jgi:hypothetical protein